MNPLNNFIEHYTNESDYFGTKEQLDVALNDSGLFAQLGDVFAQLFEEEFNGIPSRVATLGPATFVAESTVLTMHEGEPVEGLS